MALPSAENKKIARALADLFGGEVSVTHFWDDDHISDVDILLSKNTPYSGINSYATIGLSDTPLYQDGIEFAARVEIVGACDNAYSSFDKVISTCAFCIINSKWFCCPGAVFPDILSMYNTSDTMKHIFFTPPFIWGDDQPKTMELPSKMVYFLQAIPISNEEFSFLESNGEDELENLFEETQINVFDLNRKSVC